MNFENSIPFATADPHFFHDNIIKYCERPYKSESSMRQIMISEYNLKVGADDTCFFIGDVAMMGPSQYEKMTGLLNKLNGHKHLILGNHDELKPFRYLDCGFESVHTSLDVDVIIDGERKKFTLSHDPCMRVVIPKDRIMLCGHVHNLFQVIPEKDVVNVGVDVWWYKPISFKQAVLALETWKCHYDKSMANYPVSIPSDDEVVRPHQEVS